MTQDAISNITPVLSLVPAVRNADANGTGVNLANCEGVTVHFILGDSADTLSGTNKISLELEESADDVTYTDVADSDILRGTVGAGSGQFGLVDAPTEDQTVISCGYRGSKLYIRPVVNFSGTHTTGTPVSVLVIKHYLHQLT